MYPNSSFYIKWMFTRILGSWAPFQWSTEAHFISLSSKKCKWSPLNCCFAELPLTLIVIFISQFYAPIIALQSKSLFFSALLAIKSTFQLYLPPFCLSRPPVFLPYLGKFSTGTCSAASVCLWDHHVCMWVWETEEKWRGGTIWSPWLLSQWPFPVCEYVHVWPGLSTQDLNLGIWGQRCFIYADKNLGLWP